MTKAVRKAVIPAAGLGTRFLPATKAQPKEMLPVVDKPAIQYVVEEAVRAGIDDILIITGRGKRSLEDHFDRSIELEVALEASGKHDQLSEVRGLADLADIHYVRQGEALGLGHAVSVTRKHVGDEPFVVMLGDDIMDERSTVLEDMIGVYEPHRRLGRGVQVVPARGDLVLRLRRPRADRRAQPGAPAGHRREAEARGRAVRPGGHGPVPVHPEIFDAIDRTKPGVGGEIQLTDAIAILLAEQPVYGFVFDEGRFDIGKKLDYLRATVELALDRDDLGPEFAEFLADVVRRRGIV